MQAHHQPDDRAVGIVIPHDIEMRKLVGAHRVEGDAEYQADDHPDPHAAQIDALAGSFRELVGDEAREQHDRIDRSPPQSRWGDAVRWP